MPSDDLILNLRQIAGYPSASQALASDSVVLQRGGLGGPYMEISPATFVSTALAVPGNDMTIGGKLSVLSVQGGSAQFSNAAVNMLSAVNASFRQMDASYGSISGAPIATIDYVDMSIAQVVSSFNGRKGDVILWIQDILKAGGAPIYSPRFIGSPHADTPCPWSNSTRLATTAFVHGNIIAYIDNFIKDHPFVFTFNGRTGDVVLTEQDILDAGGGTVFDSVALTGVSTAPTAPYGTDTTQIATTEFVQAAINGQTQWAPLDSPAFSGYVTAPTANPGTSDAQVATTAFVMNAVTESTTGVASFNGRTGAVTLILGDVTAAGGAPAVSPAFGGVPIAPTADPGTNTQQLATTAFVMAAVGAGGVSSFNGRNGAVLFTEADLTGVGGALLDSPQFTGLPSGPTAAPGTSTTQLATTAFVLANLGVSTFNGRSGPVTLAANDVSAAGGLINPSAAMTGVPTAPTAAVSTNTTQIATTAFVQAALSLAGGVSSFNGRAGAIVLNTSDIVGAGGAPLNAPGFTGVPTAPTAAPATATTQLATTAFVMNAIATAGGVTTFNTRAGAVSLLLTDITGAGGAPINAPTFTGGVTVNGAAGNYALRVNPGTGGNSTSGITVSGGIQCSNDLTMTSGSYIRPSNYGIFGIVSGQAPVQYAIGELYSGNGNTNISWSTVYNFAYVNLPAGEWDVWAAVQIIPSGGANMSTFYASIGTSSQGSGAFWMLQVNTGTAAWGLSVGQYPFRFSGSGYVYLTGVGYGAGGQVQINGYIWARRSG